jgi:hypothetical protein
MTPIFTDIYGMGYITFKTKSHGNFTLPELFRVDHYSFLLDGKDLLYIHPVPFSFAVIYEPTPVPQYIESIFVSNVRYTFTYKQDIGQDIYFFISKYYPLGTLKHYIAKHSVPFPELCKVSIQLVEAVTSLQGTNRNIDFDSIYLTSTARLSIIVVPFPLFVSARLYPPNYKYNHTISQEDLNRTWILGTILFELFTGVCMSGNAYDQVPQILIDTFQVI